MAIKTGAPIRAAFCTISTETRLVMTIAPCATFVLLTAKRACQLVERVMAPNVFADNKVATPHVKSRCMRSAGLMIQLLAPRQGIDGFRDGGFRKTCRTIDRRAGTDRFC